MSIVDDFGAIARRLRDLERGGSGNGSPSGGPSPTLVVFFNIGSADLTPGGERLLDDRFGGGAVYGTVAVDGHCDASEVGLPFLCKRRTEGVVEYLRDRHGVPAGCIVGRSHGATKPLVSTPPGISELQNRRVEVVLK